ncbi:unnamed protein product, partial [marine sediment metagenome]
GAFSRMFGTSYIELIESPNRKPKKIFQGRLWGDLGFIHLCYDIRGMREMKKMCQQVGFPFKVDSETDHESSVFDMGEASGHFAYVEEDFDDYTGIFNKGTLLPLLGAFGLSIVIVGVSYALSMLLPETFSTAAIILFITTFGIAFSFVPKIKQIKKTFQTGMYIILVFCLVVSSMADLTKLANISFSLFWYVGLAMFGSHILHVFIAKFFKIDADTVIISGSALICSPPFVPVIAAALKNKEIILTGLTVGIAGYAVGNYLGVLIAFILK